MRDTIRHFVAEFVGIFGLVFVGGGAIFMVQKTGMNSGLIAVAMAHGLILALMVTATMRVSGHLNPAVTAGFLVTRRIEPFMAGIYVAAQIIGALAAAYAIKSLVTADAYQRAQGARLLIDLNVSGGQAFALEAIGTFFLVFVVFGTAVDPEAPKIGGLGIGFTLAANIFAFGPLTGSGVNPARALGPAVASGNFEGQLVYWIGPLVGGMLAAAVYDALFLPRRAEPVTHGRIDTVPTRPT